MHFGYLTWSVNGAYFPERANSWLPHHFSSVINAECLRQHLSVKAGLGSGPSSNHCEGFFKKMTNSSHKKEAPDAMHCGLRNIWYVFPANMATCAYSRSPWNNSVRPYLSCWSSVIPIATPQRWQISAGDERALERMQLQPRLEKSCRIV